jgi:hypothetical protein
MALSKSAWANPEMLGQVIILAPKRSARTHASKRVKGRGTMKKRDGRNNGTEFGTRF